MQLQNIVAVAQDMCLDTDMVVVVNELVPPGV